MTSFILGLFTGYLLGSIPSGYLVGKFFKGIDIRDFGSENIGFANALRVLGFFPGLVVLIADIGKGVIAVCIGYLISPLAGINPQISGGMVGLLSIIGHNWTIFLKFKGGKGVATTAGVFLSLTPLPFIFAVLVMIAVVGLTRYVSSGSTISGCTLPLFIWLCMKDEGWFYIILSIITAGFIVFKHRSNIKRLLKGEEMKLGEGVKKESI
ncbi:MAG: glycerol-3-phosphate 1-O-acyltransferase PlsY [Candidatus Aerophobetes bacterium]|nr:glycerol-3-phosphate 1-O-acyltransferase PlsY [Candidatus Aerophobetes bacterium]